jgi:acyl-CoA reductase-like NAD-dependent aldehyde dehydrogenase
LQKFNLLIAGQGSKNKSFEPVVTPYSGEVIAEVETATVQDIERAVDQAVRAQFPEEAPAQNYSQNLLVLATNL